MCCAQTHIYRNQHIIKTIIIIKKTITGQFVIALVQCSLRCSLLSQHVVERRNNEYDTFIQNPDNMICETAFCSKRRTQRQSQRGFDVFAVFLQKIVNLP